MEKVKVFYDPIGNSLVVWFEEPTSEYVCDETVDEIVLMKNAAGKVIGFEKLNYALAEPEKFSVEFETMEVV